jgi:hypothetical protein
MFALTKGVFCSAFSKAEAQRLERKNALFLFAKLFLLGLLTQKKKR